MEQFIAEVRNLKDPWESGRVQIRVYGRHDNEQDTKDENLPWATVMMPITSASTNRIGTSPTGLLVGSRVMGYWLDEAHQYPVIIGSFHRAGKLKDENDNTGGKDDIDDKYSDIPIGARASSPIKKSNTQAKKTTEKRKYDPTKEPKYNKNDYVSQEDGEDGLEKSREKNAKTADKKTVASVDKTDTSGILDKILKVDGSNESGALPMAPQMFQQIFQLNNMTSTGGINGMTSGALGGSLGGIAGGMGIGNVLGSMTGMLGIDLSMLSGMTGMLGGRGSGGGSGAGGNNFGVGGGVGGAEGTYYAEQVPTTPNDVAVTAAELLNQLGGYSTPTETIANLPLDQKEILYTAILDLMNSVSPDLYVRTVVSVSESTETVVINPKEQPTANLETVISSTPAGPTTQLILPGSWVWSVDDIPDGYFQVYYFTDTDPYPGYMQWEGPNGERVFCNRPANMPYVATPSEDVINAGIFAMINDLITLIKAGKLTIAEMTTVIENGTSAVQNQGLQNTHGKGSGGNNTMNMIQSLLGVLGQLIGEMGQKQFPESVLDQGKVQKTMEDFQLKNANLRRKKQLAKQSVQQKNDSNTMLNNNLMGFGNMNGGGSNPSGSKGTTPVGTPVTSNTATYITKTGNTVTNISTIPVSNTEIVQFGYYSIYKS